MSERFELVYMHGGHCGPFDGLSNALLATFARINGVERDNGIEIKPYVTRANEVVDVLQVFKTSHACHCKACTLEGETFYAIHKLRKVGF